MTMTISGTSGLTFPSGGAQTDVGIGSNNTTQTWQNLSATRVKNTTYTNSTGRPIMVIIYSGGGGSGGVYFTVNGVQMYVGYTASGTTDGAGGVIVPAGATYLGSVAGTLTFWYELR